MAESLKNKAVKGTVWSSLERFSVQGIQFVIMIVMARILTPADYGLVGMLAIFIAIAQSLIDSGFSQALIRKQDRRQTDNDTVFYFNIGVGIILYLILFLTAPLIAAFYAEPQLTLLTRIICLGIIINSLTVVQRAIYTINIDFKTQAKATLIGAIASGATGITMAYTGFGVWSIVAQQITNLAVSSAMLWTFSSWRPTRTFSAASFREMFTFGSKLALSGIIDTIYRNIYLIVIGKMFRASDLGYYTRAHQFADFPSTTLTSIIQRVTFPVLCTIQDDDQRLASAYRRILRVSAFVIFPLMTGLSALATPFVLTILNPTWAYAATLLSILCFAMMWYPIHAVNLNLLQVKGRSDLFLRLEIYKKIIGIAILCITIPMGLTAMCVGLIVSSLLALVINTHYTGRLIHVGFLRQMRDLTPTLLYTLSMWAIVTILITYITPTWLQLLAGTIAGATYYLLITTLTRSRDLRELIAILHRR